MRIPIHQPLAACLLATLPCLGSDWTQFRGPNGQGVSEVGNLPLTWSDDSKNVDWKSPIDGLGWSSPVVQDGQIWLTSAVEEDAGLSLRATCLDLASGKTIRRVEVFNGVTPLKIHNKNSHASPTPVIHGDRVYVHFGTYGTACLNYDGEILWKQVIQWDHVHGPGGSAAIFEDLLIFSCDGRESPFVVALDCDTGAVRWKTFRPENPWDRKFAFSTPTLAHVDGSPQMIIPGAGSVVAYDPRDGRQLWYAEYPEGYSVIPQPVLCGDLAFLSTGYSKPSILAIRVDGQGNVTDSHIKWSTDRGAPHSPSPLILGDELYMVSDRGIATCLDAASGKVHWQERLGGNYSASPLFGAGRIYFLDEDGGTTVIRPGKQFQELARSSVTGQTLASLVPIEGALLLRTDTHLMRINAAELEAE